MVQKLEDAGLSFTGKDESGRRMEVVPVIILWWLPVLLPSYYGFPSLIVNFLLQIVELSNHPYFVGVQFHPEFKSRPGKPSALFLGILLCPPNPF